MIWRSMPFSLLTCSMTRFRSGSMDDLLHHAFAWRGPRRPELRGPLPPGEGNSNSVLARSIRSSASDTTPASGSWTVIDCSVTSPSTPRNCRRPSIGLLHAHAHELANGAPEVLGSHQWTVQSRRRALEMIASRHGIVRFEDIAQLARHARQLVERHARCGRLDGGFGEPVEQ